MTHIWNRLQFRATAYRLTLTTCVVLLVWAPWAEVHAEEEEPTLPILAPLDSQVIETSWYQSEPVIVAPVTEGVVAESADQQSLEERVAALEKLVEANPADTSATLPPPETCDCPSSSLKRVDLIEDPTYKLRGRLYVDGITYDDDNATAAFFNKDRENEFGFDTARLGLEGYVYENVHYIIEVEFEGTETDYKDVFAEYQSLPGVGNFRAGFFKEPIGLEELTSSRFTTFMERSYASLTFAPSRNFGVMMYNSLDACDDASWFLGGFRTNSDDSPNGIATNRSDSNDWAFDARFAWLPYYDEPSDGRYLVHLGTSYSYRHTLGPSEFETGAWVGNQPPIGVGAMSTSDDYNQIGFEFAVVWGAMSVQSEYFQAFTTGGQQYNGASVECSYFLTGENRGYDKRHKCFDRVHPFEPAFWVDTCDGCCCGRGAWEIAGGYSFSNLREGLDIMPGTLERAWVDGFIFGVNWYLNPHSRVMFDYNYEVTKFVDSGTPDSNANLFGVRWQVDW